MMKLQISTGMTNTEVTGRVTLGKEGVWRRSDNFCGVKKRRLSDLGSF